MEIIPDWKQVLLNTAPFLVAVVGMYIIILKPMLTHLFERSSAIKGGHEEADRIEKQINDRMEEYDAKLAAARDEIAALRAEKRAEAQEKYDTIVADSRTAAEAQIEAAVGEINAAKDAASAQLKTMSGEIADQVAGQVLGRSLTAGA
jgi:F0F1-type ATP synthase membrane subunit b/b'